MKNLIVTISIVFAACFYSEALAKEWKVHSIDHEGQGADGVRFADVNGDGLLDITSGWEEAGESRVYIHPGVANVKKPWPKVVVGQTGPVEDAVFCDLDGDGSFDVISASENMNIYIHWAPKNRGDYMDNSAWQTEPIPLSMGVQKWMITIPLQIDGKNGPDILAAGKGDNVVWFESPPNARDLSQWKMHVITDKSGWMMGFMATDMDRDGDQDVLLGVRTINKGVKWLENPGVGPQQEIFWNVHDVGEPGSSAGFVEATDIDHDGFIDVIAPLMEAKAMWIFRGLAKDSQKWQIIEIDLPNTNNKGIAVGDIDLDGKQEIVVAYEYAVMCILKHDGNIEGHWTYEKIASGGKFDDVTLYDVDNDGDLDAFTTDERGLQVIWCENPAK